MVDSGCQVNLAKGPALPRFCWEETTDRGATIEGTPVSLKAKSELFPIAFNGVSDKLALYRLDSISDDCVLGS